MAINIMYELEERMKKIEYVSMDSDCDYNFAGSENHVCDNQLYKSLPKIDEIADNINQILLKLDENNSLINKKENSTEIECMVNLLISLYDMLEEIQEKYKDEGSSAEIKKIIDKFNRGAEEIGLEIENPINKKYNFRNHEVALREKKKGKENQTIIKVLRKGFIYNGRVLRKAAVVIVQN